MSNDTIFRLMLLLGLAVWALLPVRVGDWRVTAVMAGATTIIVALLALGLFLKT